MKWYYAPSFIVIMLIIATSLIIALSSDLAWQWTGSGLANFVEIFKIPLTLTGSLLIIISLSVAIHRAQQGEKQLKLIEVNNFRSNYIELAKNYHKYEQKGIKIDLVSNFTKFFPYANSGIFEIDFEIKNAIINSLEVIAENCKPKLYYTFGYRSGFSLLMLVPEIEKLSENLIIMSKDEYVKDLWYVKREYSNLSRTIILLAEFISNFEPDIYPSALNRIKQHLIEFEKGNDLFHETEKMMIDYSRSIQGSPDFEVALDKIKKSRLSNRFIAYAMLNDASFWSKGMIEFSSRELTDELSKKMDFKIRKPREILSRIRDVKFNQAKDLIDFINTDEYKKLLNYN